MDYIVKAENIKLTYKIQKSFNFKKFFLGRGNPQEMSVVNALKGVSFSLERGKNLGLIGTNGSGKSTLLRVVSGTYSPDEGNISIDSDSTQLLTLGLGFLNELSGRENLILNALLLGISKYDLENGLTEEIIEFSEIGQYIDNPMYSYSSGMKSRLTFSVAACIQPELLLLDEVFSVGDAHFRAKSEERIKKMIHSDKSVILVSHSERNIEEHCDEVLWLHLGEVKMEGSAKDVIKEYRSFMNVGEDS